MTPAMCESGVPWIGEVPTHWAIAPLYARYSVQLGKMLNPEAAEGPDQSPYLGNSDVQWGLVNVAELSTMSFSAGERERFRLRPKDLLVCEGGDVGRTAVWRSELPECFYQKALHRLRPLGKDAEPEFFFFLMRAATDRGAFLAGGNKSTLMHLTGEKLRSHRFPFPPLDEQLAIAAFLRHKTTIIDALIAKKERLVELLQEKRRVLITQAITMGLDPSVPMKESGVEWLGQIPAHWSAERIANLATKITNGYVGPTRDILVSAGVRYLQSLHIKSNAIVVNSENEYFVTKEWSQAHERSILKAGDVLVVQTGDIGQVACVPPSFAGSNCHALIIISLAASACRGSFLSLVLNSHYGFHLLKSIQTGALHPHLNCTFVREIRIPLPPLKEQDEILAAVDREVSLNQDLERHTSVSVKRLREYRQALITAAVTGKIDVTKEPG